MKMLKIVIFHLLFLTLLCSGIDAISARVRLYSKDRNLILKLHNDFRRSVEASNMMELVWDPLAAKAAADWGEKCLYSARPDNEWGQSMNQFSETATEAFSPAKIIRDSFKEWKLYDHHKKDYKNCSLKHTCSYVQLLKAEVSGVGCALMKCPDLNMINDTIHNGQLFVCFYTPRGNIQGQAPYLEGLPCSACRSGMKCINRLCTESKDTNESMHISLEAPQIRIGIVSDRRFETNSHQANVALADGIKETDRNSQDAVPNYGNVVIPFPGQEERADVRLFARMERRRNRQHNSHHGKKASERNALSDVAGHKGNSPLRRKRQVDEYTRRRNEELRRQQLQAIRDRQGERFERPGAVFHNSCSQRLQEARAPEGTDMEQSVRAMG
ncbi:hypothetical protein ACJMK2_033819 [Sinanodonta woodiana]|uniref:SCP domain-containing protein n=1 Tax=Sinanodonta woodiana TaxID=1069815 RepID=A0ABD3WPK0_SINWO